MQLCDVIQDEVGVDCGKFWFLNMFDLNCAGGKVEFRRAFAAARRNVSGDKESRH